MRYMRLCIVLLLITPALAQDFNPEEDDPNLVIVPVTEEKPLSPPPDMPQAAQTITDTIGSLSDELAVIAGHDAFLHDNLTLNLTNKTDLYLPTKIVIAYIWSWFYA